ncbi:MAG: type II/IV secretion system protein [Myxococcales bacterium]|nr:MAG: type II/IV secretion system protein [Myxococcales bacterium]
MTMTAAALRKPFTVESVGELLVGYGYLTPETLAEAVKLAPKVKIELEKAHQGDPHFAGTRKYDVLPTEVLAGLQLPSAHDFNQIISEDLIYEILARAEGMRYVKIDPLKLDSKIVTGYFSRPFARRAVAVPIDRQGTNLFVAIANPYDSELYENLQRITGLTIIPALSAKSDILKVITDVYGFRRSVSAAEASIEKGIDLGNLEQFFTLPNVEQIEENDRHIINAVDYLLHYAFEQRASDIHVEPKREVAQIRMRIDGVLHDIYTIPQTVHPPVVSRIKAMSRLDIAERRRPQDGRMKMGLGDREVEIRVSTVPTVFGEKAVLRIFDAAKLLVDIDQLGFEADDLSLFHRIVQRPQGLILVTGPTGSGKTTTLYSTLRMLASPEVNITTIEDPIEMVVDEFNQIAVHRRIDLGFAQAMKYILRQDPDIIMVGEIRDPETAEQAVQAALTGHLVFSTLHTNDSVTAVARLIELGVKPYLISSTLTMVVAQRLARKICPYCKQETHLSEPELAALGLKLPEGRDRLKAWFGEGCVRCRHIGLYERTGVFEVLEITEKLQRLIKEQADARELRKIARQDGLVTLAEAGIKKLARGVTSYEEVMRVLAM